MRGNNLLPLGCRDEAQVKNLKWHKRSSDSFIAKVLIEKVFLKLFKQAIT